MSGMDEKDRQHLAALVDTAIIKVTSSISKDVLKERWQKGIFPLVH